MATIISINEANCSAQSPDLTVCMAPPISGRDLYGMGRPSGGVCTTGAAEGDIEAIVDRDRNPNRCDCDLMLLRQLQRASPYR